MLPRPRIHAKILVIASAVIVVFTLLLSPFSGAHAAEPGSGGVSDTPDALPCGPGQTASPGSPICTDAFWAQQHIQKVKSRIDFQLTFAAYLGVLNAATYFAQTVAYDSAEWVANGFKGKAPGIFTDPFGQYTKNLLLDSVGEFMGTFSEEFTQGAFGVDLCRPPNFPQLGLEFALGLPGLSIPGLGRPRPKCSWTDIVDNWEASASTIDNLNAFNNIKGSFSTGGNDVAFGVGANLAFFDFVAEKQYAGILDRREGSGFKSVQNFVSGAIETPGETVRRSIENQIIENPAMAQNINQGALISNAFTLGWVQLGVVTASTFTNVLVTRLFDKIKKGLFKSSGGGPRGLPDLLNPFGAPPGSTYQAEIFSSQFGDILTPRIIRSEEQDLIAELSGCPTDARSKWNCAMDDSFATLLRQGGGMTLRQAIDGGFINANWQLIPSTRVKDNQDPTCRTRAFCVANLRKLRLARILPIGWELAADSPANQLACAKANGCVTLREVIDRFDDCNDEGRLDDKHPWCHLIDPNWVLTAFPAQCVTKGFGNQLLPNTGQRLEECQDTVTCLERDKNGACIGGYGFCMAEQTFWQFDAQSCSEQNVSCRTYTPRGNTVQPISYLRSTLDYGACNETNVGCLWYASRRNAVATSTSNAWDATYEGTTNKVYFDKTILPCSGSFDGCSDLRRVTRGQSALNLVQNGSFESTTGTGLLGWTALDTNLFPDVSWTYTLPSPASGSPAAEGAQALLAPPLNLSAPKTTDRMLAQFVTGIRGRREYTLSFRARAFADKPSLSGIVILFQKGIQNDPANPFDFVMIPPGSPDYFRSSGCNIPTAIPGMDPNSVAGTMVPSTLDTEWQNFSCTFLTSKDVGQFAVFILGGTDLNKTVLYDAVQLEESELQTEYLDGLNAGLPRVNMRIPPQELGCTGNEKTDHPLCKNYARVCTQLEAGCQGYRPSGNPGASEIPAVLTPVDYCPNECVGYAEFRKQASTFDLARSANPAFDDPDDDTVAYFIPDTALQCSAQNVGCEAFTNLEAGAEGESEQGFSYLRSCEKPGPDSQTYFTWEGSDTTGYQLKTWSLKRDTTAPFPQGPKVLVKAGPDGTVKDPAVCNPAFYVLGLDPDCRQFYDPEGTVFYRFESQTILSSDQCAQWRKSDSTKADCEKTGGQHNAATNECVYFALGDKSRSCDISVAGCRAYIGTQGLAQAEVFNEDFIDNVDAAGAVSDVTLSQSNEAVLVGDKSLFVAANAVPNARLAFDVPTEPGTLYELTFWAKITSPNKPVISIRASEDLNDTTIGTAELEPDWNIYRIGPFFGSTSTAATTTPIMFSGFPSVTFIDKVRVEQVTDIAYVVKNSWNTPAICDQTSEGIPHPQAMLGCSLYTDRKNVESPVRQFTRLCRDTAIGCTAFIDTKNSDNPYADIWTKLNERPFPANIETTIRPGDTYEYFIDDASYYCPAEQVSCRAFGKPKYSQDRLSLDPKAPFETVYLKDDVTKYNEGLCSEAELFCESYTYNAAGQAGTAYFRAPADHACEFRNGVVVPQGTVPNVNTVGRTFDGWFRIGTDIPCYPEFLKAGSEFGITFTGDPGYNAWTFPTSTYRAWTGVCPNDQAECTEFRDVTDKSDTLHPQGRPYFVIRSEKLDTESCNGQVDPGRGCVLFRDMSDTFLAYSTQATYRNYAASGYRPVDPLNCDIQPNHPACLKKYCTMSADPSNIFAGDAGLLKSIDVYNANNKDCTDNEAVCAPDVNYACAVWAQNVSGPCPYKMACSNRAQPDTNIIVKVSPDRSCSQWLSCRSGETVTDPATGKLQSICSDLALCNANAQSEGDAVPYCRSFVNREQPFSTILIDNQVVDAQVYADRRIGFGTPDYSGFTIPDHFQVMDAELVPVGSMLSPDPKTKSKYKKDYRLAIPLDMDTGGVTSNPARAPSPDELKTLAGAPNLQQYACVYKKNGSFGIRTNAFRELSATGTVCWVSMDQGQPPQLAGAGAPIVSDNLNALNLVQRFEQGDLAGLDQILSRSFPNTVCKAAPEGDAPFSNDFVVEWDDSVNPPEPLRVSSGYGNANLCEFGENCSCTYKRVTYGGSIKFYEPLSTNVVNAVCSGGPRDGQPCVVDRGIEGSEPPQNATVKDSKGQDVAVPPEALAGEKSPTDPDRICGEGGTCVPIKNVQLVRGISGQCLQYDQTRNIAGDPSRNECLIWNPNPAFAGPGDPYHWSPTAGFQPPQSSGRYYCSSPVREPKKFQITAEGTLSFLGATYTFTEANGLKKNSAGTYAGKITKPWFAQAITSDKSCVDFPNPFGDDCDGNEGGGSLDGSTSAGTDMGRWCEYADDDQSPSSDFKKIRLVTTGRGGNHSYAEYAYLFDRDKLAENIAGGKVDDPEILLEHTLEDTLSSFEFGIQKGRIGCGYSEDFVEGASVSDYDDEDEWSGPDSTWVSRFRAELAKSGNKLDRKKSGIVTEDGSPSGVPVTVECNNEDNAGSQSGTCFLKYWQLDYRAEGQDRFQAFSPDIGRASMDSLSKSPVYGKCTSDKSWFSIRAVFEDTNKTENDKDPETVKPDQLVGPFQIVGLWVTACAPHSGPRYIYLDLHLSTADVCRELNETISKDSKESVAYTDRNSSRSGFAIPKVGFQWGTTNIPFGASLATGDAGPEPLYMSGVSQAASTNPLNPPTFTFPGQTYFRNEPYPTNNWGALSNIFARIYRVYGYFPRGVGREDWACTDPRSPGFGQWCPPDEGLTSKEFGDASEKICGFQGKCLKTGVDPSDIFATKVCNSFSGVNRGLDCSNDPDICHRGPVQEENGILQPQYASCALFDDGSNQTWTQLQNGKYKCSGSGCPTKEGCTAEIGCERGPAVRSGAFRCQGSVRDPGIVGNGTASWCTKATSNSPECPSAEADTCKAPTEDEVFRFCQTYYPNEVQNCINGNPFGNGVLPGRCERHSWAECFTDNDCKFEFRNYWPSGQVNSLFRWGPEAGSTPGQFNKKFDSPWNEPKPESYYGVTPQGASPTKLDPVSGEEPCPDGKNCLIKNAFTPAKPLADGTKFYATPIAPQKFPSYWSTINSIQWDDSSMLGLFPGFAPHILLNRSGYVCSFNFFDEAVTVGGVKQEVCTVDDAFVRNTTDTAPFVYFTWRSSTSCSFLGKSIPGCSKPNVGNASLGGAVAHYAACEPLALMFRSGFQTSGGLGVCRGGTRAGASCQSDKECAPPDLDPTLQLASRDWCKPVTSGEPNYGPTGSNTACWTSANPTLDPNSPFKEPNPALDNNLCTHPPGYWPRPNFCKDPNDEYCGLFGYDLGAKNASVSDKAPLPTDVTAGLYTPSYLNPGGSNVAKNSISYNYIAYYNPEPPRIAAPDIRTCQGGQCRITGLGSFSIDGVAEGIVNGGSGNHVATVRFYAWASREQMPLRRVIIDWGDGSVTELPDANMKNRKPYCQTPKECTLTPGLTCQTNADCPPGGGTCESYGSCATRPSVRCYRDQDCTFGGEAGVCVPRVTFDNDSDACQENFFEFRHAYSCLPDNVPSADCQTTGGFANGVCSGDPTKACGTCAVGDVCIQNTSTDIKGCFDKGTNTCRYTPRIMVIDNWGWCTGECRNALNQSGLLIDAAGSPILHPNGGCYDASRVKSNVNFTTPVGPNECNVFNPSGTQRPWVVYPGSVQMLPGEAL